MLNVQAICDTLSDVTIYQAENSEEYPFTQAGPDKMQKPQIKPQ